MERWTRGDRIAVIGLVVAIVGIILALMQPEVRSFLGLDHASPPSSIPVLHSSYSGTFTDTTQGTHGQLTIWNVSEVTTTGTFTGTGTSQTAGGPTCSFQVANGRITGGGKMTWIINYEQSNACTGTANATGQLNSDDGITGSWTNTSIQDTGTFTLS